MKRLIVLFMFVILLTACTQEGDILTIRTADPNVSISFKLLPPPPDAPIAPAITPDPVAVEIEEEEAPQVACEIKGNVGSSGNIYHLPGGAYYDRVKVDTSQGDMWFCTEEEAIAAGFRKSSR